MTATDNRENSSRRLLRRGLGGGVIGAILLGAAIAGIGNALAGEEGDKLDYSAFKKDLMVEDFQGSNGAAPASDRWTMLSGTGYPGGQPNWGTGEVETYTANSANVSLKDGTLAITPVKAADGSWTSGKVESKGTFETPAGGKMLISAKLAMPKVTGAAADGYWPAFWTMGKGFRDDVNSWPHHGEWDIVKAANGDNTSMHVFHCGPSAGGPCGEGEGIGGFARCSDNCWGNMHTYEVVMDRSSSPETLTFYLDGKLTHQVSAKDIPAAEWAAATHTGHFIILNVAMGGLLPRKNPDDSTASGQSMLVDQIRVRTT